MADEASKNIILLSDGTGNSSKATTPTNVWRLYKALDLQTDDQIAFYDDGVGTSGFRIFKMIGGAFGWGLKKNVLQLYRSLCEHYTEGARIYIFGFSRGSYTARILAHLIVSCGIIDTCGVIHKRGLFGLKGGVSGAIKSLLGTTPEPLPIAQCAGLNYAVKMAMRSYRHEYWKNASLFLRTVHRLFSPIRLALRGKTMDAEQFEQAYSYNIPQPVDFIGVWDTVDAVGMPVDELCDLLNNFVYPYKFLDQNLSPRVKQARHALAIDDERQTFHPVLWNESGTNGRVVQTWFAGMHSNVGGSYADDDLSHIPLIWMIRHAKEQGLRFIDSMVESYGKRADAIGKMYDSRAGFATYYRYKPRFIDDLCHDGENLIDTSPIIHESVFNRIATKKLGYNPLVIPGDYKIETADGVRKKPSEGPFPETDTERQNRAVLLDRVRSHILWRRVTYLLLLGLSAGLALLPFMVDRDSAIPSSGISGMISHLLEALFRLVDSLLPFTASFWTEAWIRSPLCFTAIILGFVVWYFWRKLILSRTTALSEHAWAHMREINPGLQISLQPERRQIFERFATKVRESRTANVLYGLVIDKFIIPVAVILTLSLVLFFSLRGIGWVVETAAPICNKDGAVQPGAPLTASYLLRPGDSKTVEFDTRSPCFKSGVIVEPGRRYVFQVTVKNPWKDGSHEAGPAGLADETAWRRKEYLFGLALRRHLTPPWFALLGELGKDSGEIFEIGRKGMILAPENRGELYFYVNDAINWSRLPIPVTEADTPKSCKWDATYRNNQGSAAITITRIQ